MMFIKRHNHFKTGLTLAALALVAVACPARAQFNNGFNPFFPVAPRMLTPLGGGVIFNNFDNGFAGGISFGNAAISNGVDNAFTATTFTSNRPTFGRIGTNNSIPNGFQVPSTIVDPFTGSIRTIDQSLFFQTNPGFSPLVVNAVNGSTVLTQGALNNQFPQFNNQPVRIFRAAPIFNPTVPNPPASAYAPIQVTNPTTNVTTGPLTWSAMRPNNLATGQASQMARSAVVSPASMSNVTVGPLRWLAAQPIGVQAMRQGMNTGVSPAQMSNVTIGPLKWLGGGTMQMAGTSFGGPRGFPAPVIGGPKVLFGSGMAPVPIFGGPRGGFPAPVIGGSKVLFGSPMSSGTVVMGGRARR